MGKKQEDDNKKYKEFIKNHEEKDLWSNRKREWEQRYPKIFESTAKSVIGRYKDDNDLFSYDPRGIHEK